MNSLLRFGCLTLLVVCAFSRPVYAERKAGLDEECYQILHENVEASEAQKRQCQLQFKDQRKIVVSGSRSPRLKARSSASIAVVTSEDIERSGAESVAEVLRDVPGVEVTDAGQAGLKRIRIRGEDSKRVAIVIDGQEFIDHREVGTPLLVSPEMIEKIEVFRGAGSVLYGGRAIGGVVLITTKKGGYHPIQAELSATAHTATDGGRIYGSVFGSHEGFDYRVLGTFTDHGDRDTPDGETENTSFDSDSQLFYLGKAFGDHRLAIQFENFDASSEVFVEEEVRTTPPFVDFSIDAPQRDREKYSANYDWDGGDGTVEHVHLDLYRQQSDREFNTFSLLDLSMGFPLMIDSRIFTNSRLMTYGGNGQVEFRPGESHHASFGVQVFEDSLDQVRTRRRVTNGMLAPDEITEDEARQLTTAVFLHDEWSINDSWTVSGGVRSYWVESELEDSTREGLSPSNISDNELVTGLSLAYHGIEDTTLWTRFGQGYVFPSLVQLGTGAFAGPSFVNPNQDLKPETSDSFELGARRDKGDWRVELSSFVSLGEDYIDHVLCSSTTAPCIQPAGSRDRVYVNVDRAKTFGAELELQKSVDDFTPYLAAAWLRRKFSSRSFQTYDTGLPNLTSRVGVKYEDSLDSDTDFWADLFLRSNSEADERESDGTIVHRGGWSTLNAQLGVEFGQKRQYQLSLDLQNLTDKRYVPATENLLAVGRSAILRVSGQI